ncbi:hypothetical protein PLAN_10060 [Planktothrix rubescens CCAP 1459/22]|uniref:Uncharacterized protein n=1 Tax=Planktothrix rubescens CCAP 1459/22 TaxID=329571 RepID=A0A6J7ZEG7_PLARU|nr:hypothetical protein PLAN_10060 [Planktothrix rubescens NIVA-CYA 18]CAD0226360.1 hypothetical protein PL10110_260065 [Planktothrix agardhii]
MVKNGDFIPSIQEIKVFYQNLCVYKLG